MKKKLILAVVVVMVAMMMVVPAFAQPVPTDRILLDASVITPNLFLGANLILVALASVVFLIAGLSFGGRILRAVADMISSLRF